MSRPPRDHRVVLDGPAAVILAALALKLSLMRAADGIYAPLATTTAALVRNGLVTVVSHVALFLLLAGLVALVAGGALAARRSAVALHLAILAPAYLDLCYARFHGLHLSLSQGSLALEGLRSLTTLASFSRPPDLLLLLDLPLLALALLAGSRPFPLVTSPRRSLRLVVKASAVFFLGIILYLEVRHPGPDVLARPYNRRYTYPVMWLLDALTSLHRTRAWPAIPPPPQGLVSPAPPRPEHPDVMLLQLESVGAGAPEWELRGRPVMPFLRHLTTRGLFARNGVSTRMHGMSFDADLGALTGFHPPPTSDPYAYRFGGGPLFPDLLRRAGFLTATWDNYVPEFFNAERNHRRLGISSFRSIRDRSWATDVDKVSVHCPGDQEFFSWVRERYRAEPSRRPRFWLVKNTTSHGPWNGLQDEPEVVRVIGRPFPGDDVTTGYACAMRYVDCALGDLLAPLLPLVDEGRLVVALYGDHGPSLDLGLPPVPGLPRDESARRHVPVVVLGLPEAPRRIDGPVGLADLAPTLARTLGLPFARGDIGGRDLCHPGPLPPLVTADIVYEGGAVRPLTAEEETLMRFGYGRLGAPR